MLKSATFLVGLLSLIMPYRWAVLADATAADTSQISTATEIRLMDPGWWPTKASFPRDQYVGSKACGRCHQELLETQSRTPMAYALSPAAGTPSLKDLPGTLHFQTGQYKYEFDRSSS